MMSMTMHLCWAEKHLVFNALMIGHPADANDASKERHLQYVAEWRHSKIAPSGVHQSEQRRYSFNSHDEQRMGTSLRLQQVLSKPEVAETSR